MKKPFGMVKDEEDPAHEDAESQAIEQAEPVDGEPDPNADPNADDPNADPNAAGADGNMASPAEQEAYNKFVAQAYLLIYKDDGMFDKVKEMLRGGGQKEGDGDPVAGLATATSMIVTRIYVSAKESGIDMTADVVWNAGKEIFEDLAEVSKRIGAKDYSQDQDAFEGAFFQACDATRLALQGTGDLDPQQFAGDFEKLQAMDQGGQLEQMFTKLADEDDAAGGMAEAATAPDDGGPMMGGDKPLSGLGKMVGAR